VPDARFVIFGKGFGESPEEQRLLDLAAELGIGESTRFAGFRPDIQRYYCALDVSVLTSLSEGLPIVLLESMIQGLPVVATAVGGTPEVVADGVTGYLVPPKDPLAFAERVTELLLDRALRERMGGAGRRRARSEFDIGRTAARYLEIYRDVSGPVEG
jgi:glycosyltransferase involved in cell wall biosynthesis